MAANAGTMQGFEFDRSSAPTMRPSLAGVALSRQAIIGLA